MKLTKTDPDADGEQIVGQYGTLTVFANGSYSYALNNANAAVQALTTGQTLTEGFAYTLKDNDAPTLLYIFNILTVIYNKKRLSYTRTDVSLRYHLA